MSEPIQPANNFAGFHVRQVPMTPEEEAKAKVAETMRNNIREFATGNDVSFLDRSPIIGAINPLSAPMHIDTHINDEGVNMVTGTVTFGPIRRRTNVCAWRFHCCILRRSVWRCTKHYGQPGHDGKPDCRLSLTNTNQQASGVHRLG